MGHLGIERTTSLLRDRFYWPSMIEDIEHHIKSCPHCLRFKTQPEKVELNPIIATRPLELVHIDYLTIEAPEGSKSDKDINVLVITDHFTRYAQAHVTSSQKAHVVAKTLWEHFFVHYGFPEKILSDQGKNFESVLISELCELTQIKKLRTTPYRPEGNGSCKRFNRTLISMLGTLLADFKSKWPQHISTLTYAYNCTRSNAARSFCSHLGGVFVCCHWFLLFLLQMYQRSLLLWLCINVLRLLGNVVRVYPRIVQGLTFLSA